MHPPQQMTAAQVAFLMNFYSRLNALPGSYLPNGELRFMLCRLLDEYPDSLVDAMSHFNQGRAAYTRIYHGIKYEGDLETDYLKFLGDTQQISKKTEAPGVEFGNEVR